MLSLVFSFIALSLDNVICCMILEQILTICFGCVEFNALNLFKYFMYVFSQLIYYFVNFICNRVREMKSPTSVSTSYFHVFALRIWMVF